MRTGACDVSFGDIWQTPHPQTSPRDLVQIPAILFINQFDFDVLDFDLGFS